MLECVVFNIRLCQLGEQALPFHVLYEFHDQTVIPSRPVADDIQESNHVGSTRKISKNLDLTVYFLRRHWLENLYYALVIVDHIDTFKHLVFASMRRRCILPAGSY